MLKIIAGAISALFLCQGAVLARDNGQWDETDPETKAWFRNAKQPDRPEYSCCGEADAYYADSIKCDATKCFAIITDERDNQTLGRYPIAVGTMVEIPPHKYMDGQGNPSGHGVIFINHDEETDTNIVLCYAGPSLV